MTVENPYSGRLALEHRSPYVSLQDLGPKQGKPGLKKPEFALIATLNGFSDPSIL